MKLNKLTIAAMGLSALSMASCSESFLDVESKTQSTTENFYQTADDAYIALIGCYDGWQCTVSNGPTFSMQETAMTLADECYGGLGVGDAPNSQVLDRFDINCDNSQQNIFDNLWKFYYRAIYRCNMLINNMSDNEDTQVKSYVAQAKAIRAILYFDLGRMFGNVPLVLTAEEGQNNPAQAEPKAVFAQVVADLNAAIECISDADNKKATTFADDAFTNDGWISKYACEAMLARVYLFYNGFYGQEPTGCTKQNAIDALEDVINNGGYSLVSDFKDLWPATAALTPTDANPIDYSPLDNTTYKRGNSETVLAMKFNYTADYNGNNDGNRTIVMVGPRTGGNLAYPIGQGWGGCTVNPLLVSELGGDSRKCSVLDIASDLGSAWTQEKTDDIRDYTGYYNKKYTPLSKYDALGNLVSALEGIMAGDFQISQCQDYVLIRYADVLLMHSELTGTADGLNQVQSRAGAATTAYSEDALRQERKLEFAFEGIRYWDLLRYGLDYAADQIEKSFTDVKLKNSDNLPSFSRENFLAKKGLLQIPGNQITISGGTLKQNPGW